MRIIHSYTIDEISVLPDLGANNHKIEQGLLTTKAVNKLNKTMVNNNSVLIFIQFIGVKMKKINNMYIFFCRNVIFRHFSIH